MAPKCPVVVVVLNFIATVIKRVPSFGRLSNLVGWSERGRDTNRNVPLT